MSTYVTFSSSSSISSTSSYLHPPQSHSLHPFKSFSSSSLQLRASLFPPTPLAASLLLLVLRPSSHIPHPYPCSSCFSPSFLVHVPSPPPTPEDSSSSFSVPSSSSFPPFSSLLPLLPSHSPSPLLIFPHLLFLLLLLLLGPS